MESGVVQILINLVGGAVGGNVAGLVNKAKSLGPVLNTILGLVGGLAGGQGLQAAGLLENLGTGGSIGVSAIGGFLLPLIGSFFKKA